MGVDYTTNFGIGYSLGETVNYNNDEYESINEYLDEILSDRSFVYFRTGCELSETDINYYIVYEDDIDEYTDLSIIKETLDSILASYDITPKGKFGLVGGLLIW